MLLANFILEKIFQKYMSPEDLEAEKERNMEYFNWELWSHKCDYILIYRKSYSIFSYRRVRSTFRKAVDTQEMEKCMQQEITRVALDAMGGDNAPGELVKGAVDAVNGRSDIKVLLVGQQDVVEKELKQYSYPKEQIEVVHAEEVIETAEPPVNAIRKKKQSSNCHSI